MTPDALAVIKIPTESPQLTRGKPARPAARAKAGRPATRRVLANGAGRTATRGGGEVIELGRGIVVYPARSPGGRWRAVGHEYGRRQQCEASSEEKLAAALEKVTERLAADAPNMRLSGADLIAGYLNPDRLPVEQGGRVSTPIPSGGCASGSPPRSSARSPARTSRPGTCSRSSKPLPRRGRAAGSG